MKFLVLMMLAACASKPTPMEEIKREFNQDNVSMNAILNITRTSFIKGCIFGSQVHYFEQVKGKRFHYCRNAAKGHAEEIKSILKGEPMTPPNN